jgi:hypothetical protein
MVQSWNALAGAEKYWALETASAKLASVIHNGGAIRIAKSMIYPFFRRH